MNWHLAFSNYTTLLRSIYVYQWKPLRPSGMLFDWHLVNTGSFLLTHTLQFTCKKLINDITVTMLSLNLRYACAWKFSLGILICSYKSVVVVALDFTIKACQNSATSFAVLQNPQWLCNLHELHNKELHSSLSSIYANREMSQHHPNQLCFPWLLSILLKTILYWIKKRKVKDICLEFWEYFSHVFKRYKCPCCQGQHVSG